MYYFIAVGFGVYIVISLIFFCFPNILHKRKKYVSEILEEALCSQDHKTLLVGHRGGILFSLFFLIIKEQEKN